MSKIKIAKEKLRNDPVDINEYTWYYEEEKEIDIVHYFNSDLGRRAIHIRIPYWKLKRTLDKVVIDG